MRLPLALRAGLFTLLVPGSVGGLLPWWLASRGPAQDWGAWRHAGWPLLAAGVAGYLACLRDFVMRGRGTPFPADAPTVFVATGLYRHVRNPMYLAVALCIAGLACVRASLAPLAWLLVVSAGFHAFVVLHEEPALARRFGAAYEDYRRRVPRWLPSLRPRA